MATEDPARTDTDWEALDGQRVRVHLRGTWATGVLDLHPPEGEHLVQLDLDQEDVLLMRRDTIQRIVTSDTPLDEGDRARVCSRHYVLTLQHADRAVFVTDEGTFEMPPETADTDAATDQTLYRRAVADLQARYPAVGPSPITLFWYLEPQPQRQ